jgi:hypothetical protein
MSDYARAGWGAGLVLAGWLIAAAVPTAAAPIPQTDVKTCLVCHDDAELKSSAGAPVYVAGTAFAASVHGRAGVGCVGCHGDLKDVEDFPHPGGLKSVNCAGCHPAYARATAGGVHGTASPRLAAAPVLCKNCHGYHEVVPSSEPASPMNRSLRPSTCGKCHAGAGPNFAKGRVHELAAGGPTTPAGVFRILYKALIPILGAFFLAHIGADLLRSRRER